MTHQVIGFTWVEQDSWNSFKEKMAFCITINLLEQSIKCVLFLKAFSFSIDARV